MLRMEKINIPTISPAKWMYISLVLISFSFMLYCCINYNTDQMNLIWQIPVTLFLSCPIGFIFLLVVTSIISFVLLVIIFILHTLGLIFKIAGDNESVFKIAGIMLFIGDLSDWLCKKDKKRPF